MWCGGIHLHNECPEKGNTASVPKCCTCKWWRGTSFLQQSGRKHAKEEMLKEKVTESTQTTIARVFFSSHTIPGQSFMVVLCSKAQSQQQPQLLLVAQACPATVEEMSALPP
jgi:hypothetical protein